MLRGRYPPKLRVVFRRFGGQPVDWRQEGGERTFESCRISPVLPFGAGAGRGVRQRHRLGSPLNRRATASKTLQQEIGRVTTFVTTRGFSAGGNLRKSLIMWRTQEELNL